MRRALTLEGDIRTAQKQFECELTDLAHERYPVTLGFQGGSIEADILWFDEVNLWASVGTISRERHWNAFGLGRPAPGGSASITCEINVPVSGVNRRVAGAYVVDSSGTTSITHSGKIGGGRPGVCKALFLENYRGRRIEVDHGGRVAQVALVCDLGSPDLLNNLSRFVREVARIKRLV